MRKINNSVKIPGNKANIIISHSILLDSQLNQKYIGIVTFLSI